MSRQQQQQQQQQEQPQQQLDICELTRFVKSSNVYKLNEICEVFECLRNSQKKIKLQHETRAASPARTGDLQTICAKAKVM